MEEKAGVEKKEKEKSSLKHRLGKILGEGLLALTLTITPAKAVFFYPTILDLERQIKTTLQEVYKDKEEYHEMVKILFTKEYELEEGGYYALTMDDYLKELEKKYEETKDKRFFYLSTLYKIKKVCLVIENYLQDSAEEAAQILNETREEIKKELEKDPYNVNLWQLMAENLQTRDAMYTGWPWWARARGKEIYIPGRRKGIRQIIDDYEEGIEKIEKILNDKKILKKGLTSYFNLSKREKKRIIKNLREYIYCPYKVRVLEEKLNGY